MSPSGRIPILLALLVAVGCREPLTPRGVSPLQQTQMRCGSVALEIVSVRFSPADSESLAEIWTAADEQHFPPELRKRLAHSGFRVGILGNQMPESLAKLLETKQRAAPLGQAQEVDVAELQTPSRVSARHLQTRPGQRSEIVSSGVLERLSVLVCEEGEIRGQTYNQAQGIFVLRATPQSDGRVSLELTPEIQHDRNRQQWVGDQAAWRLEVGRPKRVLDDLRLTATLRPGHMLLLGSQPNRPGSLGHNFFSETGGPDGPPQQKLLLVR